MVRHFRPLVILGAIGLLVWFLIDRTLFGVIGDPDATSGSLGPPALIETNGEIHKLGPARRERALPDSDLARPLSSSPPALVPSALPAATIADITADMRDRLELARQALVAATEITRRSPTLDNLVAEARAANLLRKRELCLLKLGKGDYLVLPEGSQVPSMPDGVAYLAASGYQVGGESVRVVFIFRPGDDAGYDSSVNYLIEMKDMLLEAKVGEFNNRPLAERRALIERHVQTTAWANEQLKRKSITAAEREHVDLELRRNSLDQTLDPDALSYTVRPRR